MAELGVIANVIGVVGAGLKLSVALYDFASTLGSAGGEIEDMGYDITLLCAVLKRVQSTLNSPKSTRLSVTAVQTTQDIVKRCQKILDDINGILKKLRKDGQSNVDILAKVKWTLKRPKILMLRGSLQSCTTTLHLMLSTIDWARNATRRSTNGEPDPDHDQDMQMTHSLFLAQQSANHRLEELEDRVINEDMSGEDSTAPSDSLSPSPSSSLSPDTPARHKRNHSSAMIDAVVYPASVISSFSEDKRTSVLLNECVFETDRSFSTLGPGAPRTFGHRQSIVYSEALLRRWTKQLDSTPAAEVDVTYQEDLSSGPTLESQDSHDAEGDVEDDSGQRDPIPQTLFTPSRPLEDLAKSGNQLHFPTRRDSSTLRRAFSPPRSTESLDRSPGTGGPDAPPYDIHRVGVDFRPSMEDEIELRSGQLVRILHEYDDGWALCSSLDRSEQGVAPRTCLSLNPVKSHPTNNGPSFRPESPIPEAASTNMVPRTGAGLKAPGGSSPTSPSVEFFKWFRVGYDDPCYKVLPAALKKYNIQADWREYTLYIVYGDQERAVGMDEKPLLLFKELDRQGKKPMFMLRRLAEVPPDSNDRRPGPLI